MFLFCLIVLVVLFLLVLEGGGRGSSCCGSCVCLLIHLIYCVSSFGGGRSLPRKASGAR